MKNKVLSIMTMCLSVISGICIMQGCNIGYELDDLSQYSRVCELSGGTYTEGKCYCSDYQCDDGFVCDMNTKMCSADSSVSGVCVTGTVYCANGREQKCLDGVWSAPNVCDTMLCEDHEHCAERCLESACSGTKLRKCENGIFQRPFQCAYGCNEDKTDCASSACASGSYRCIGDIFETCDSGGWGNEIKCKLGCDENTQKCITECKEGETRCFDDADGNGTQETCIRGVWVAEACMDNEEQALSCNGIVCGECLNSEEPYDCENNEKRVGQQITCLAGKKVYTSCGRGLSCDETQKGMCGECLNGEIMCRNDYDTQIGYQSMCMGGRFSKELAKTCSQNASCLTETICGVCRNDYDTACMNLGTTGFLQKCVNGMYTSDLKESCFAGYSCNADKDGCGVCENGSKMCDNNSSGIGEIFECMEGDWIKIRSCGSVGCTDSTSCSF